MTFTIDWKKYLHSIRKREVELVFRHLPLDGFESGFEFGAGDGFQSSLLSQKFPAYIATDLNFSRLKEENKLSHVEYKKIDADNIPLADFDKKFDFIFSASLIEHLSSRERFLQKSALLMDDESYAVHIVPTRWLKLFYIVFFYPNVCRLIFNRCIGLFQGKKVFRGEHINVENNIHQEPVNRWKKIFLVTPHGNYTSNFREFIEWKKIAWEDLFTKNGYEIVKEIKGPVFSGYGFGFDFFRKCAESLGISSETIFILRKRKNFKNKYFFSIDPKKINIAIIAPREKGDYLANTVIDGLSELVDEGKNIELYMTDGYPLPFENQINVLADEEFVSCAKTADIVLFFNRPNGYTRFDTAEKIGGYDKIIYFDGSELRGDNRFDPQIQKEVAECAYRGFGKIDVEMLEKCALYFRREKPYIKNIIPLPYGIERRYIHYTDGVKKDIDFVCIFGQEVYSMLRKPCREALEDFCRKNGFSCITSRTKGFSFEDSKVAGRNEFYDILARAKVGVSISGGGFDTARFWETLGNNCLLLTEKIDIFKEGDTSLDYERIWQFRDVEEFKKQLEKVGEYLRKSYTQVSLSSEYEKILEAHSSKARALAVLSHAKEKGMIKKNLQ